MYSNCALRSGCDAPSFVLRLACRLYFKSFWSKRATVRAPMRYPFRRSSTARWLVLLQVQRSGDIGSPRVVGATNRSSSPRTAGCCCLIAFFLLRLGAPAREELHSPEAPLGLY